MANDCLATEPYGFEIGPIRPPSEAASLLVRVMRNCAWNRCLFCPVYKQSEFSLRPVEHVKRDIDLVHKYLLHLSGPTPSSRSVSSLESAMVPGEAMAFDAALRWYRNGMQSVFLQDADALVAGSTDLAEILTHLKIRFPSIQRITSYSRSSTVNKMGPNELQMLRKRGLDRIHIGMESGSDKVLKIVRKGASKKIHVSAGVKVKEAGFELSEYVMPGLGGRSLSDEHALESADALNRINPDFIRLRPLAIPMRAPLYDLLRSGQFQPCNDVQVAQEIRLMIEHLDGISSMIVSDHILNLFADLNGRLPEDQHVMLGIIDRFLGLDEEEQVLYRFGRRLGVFSSLDDLSDSRRVGHVAGTMKEYGVTMANVDEIVAQLMQRFI
jgi:histone acetyltransferase (RNA polymerase elongator complex component)